MVSLNDIIGEVEFFLKFDDMGYELECESFEDGVAYLTCKDLEEEVKEEYG